MSVVISAGFAKVGSGIPGCGMYGQPFHHNRNACQWIAAMILPVMNGNRQSDFAN